MARAIWSGVLSFGLVSVPVRVYSATEAHEPRFHQFEKGTSDRIRYQRVNERTGDEVEYGDIVKGADVGGGSYVIIDQDELDSVAPGRSRSLEISSFVDLDEIDPIYFSKAYYLGPGNDDAKKTYALLREAMASTGKAAIASFVMRNKEYLAAVRADSDALVLETLYFADEVRNPREQIGNLPGHVRLSQQELKMASQLIESMSGQWKPEDYRDTYTDRINDLIDAKRNNEEITPAEEAPTATNVVDLVEALRASLDAARKSGSSGSKDPAKKGGRSARSGSAQSKKGAA